MANYLPKSKYSIKYTNGGLLATVSDNVEYIGKYIHTSTNSYIAGTKLKGPSLKLLEAVTTNMDRNQRALLYSSSKTGKDIFNKLKIKKNIPPSKPQPTKKDYKKGYFTRFFIYKNNEPYIIYETSKKYMDEFQPTIDSNLYTINSINWGLKGEDAIFNNDTKIKTLQIQNPYIKRIFSLIDEYVEFEEDKNLLSKLKTPNQMLDEIPTFTLKQWNMFNSLDKEKLILKYGEVNISDL